MRTDRFQLCSSCALRVAEAPCPRCGSTQLHDGREPGGPARGLEALRARERRRRWRAHLRDVRAAFRRFLPSYLLGAGIMMAFPVWMAWVVRADDSGAALKILLWALGMGLSPLAVFFLWPYPMLDEPDRRRAKREAEERLQRTVPPIEIWPARGDAAVPRVTASGVVRGTPSLTGPLSGAPCVAWRLIGEGPAGAIDEAEAVPFVLETLDGEIDVDAGVATVAIDAPGIAMESVPRKVHRLLEPRWAFPGEGAVRVREALLSVGDPVRVIGAEDVKQVPDGYRGTRDRRTLVDRPSAPLEISRVVRE